MSACHKPIPLGVALASIILVGIPCYDLLSMYHAGLRFGTIMRPWAYFVNLNASSKYWGILRMWWVLYPCATVPLLLGKNWFRHLFSIVIVVSLLDSAFNGLVITMRGMPPNWGPTMWWAHAAVVVLLYLPSSTSFFSEFRPPGQTANPTDASNTSGTGRDARRR
jgi:hypothetical protein